MKYFGTHLVNILEHILSIFWHTSCQIFVINVYFTPTFAKSVDVLISVKSYCLFRYQLWHVPSLSTVCSVTSYSRSGTSYSVPSLAIVVPALAMVCSVTSYSLFCTSYDVPSLAMLCSTTSYGLFCYWVRSVPSRATVCSVTSYSLFRHQL